MEEVKSMTEDDVLGGIVTLKTRTGNSPVQVIEPGKGYKWPSVEEKAQDDHDEALLLRTFVGHPASKAVALLGSIKFRLKSPIKSASEEDVRLSFQD